VFPVAISNGEPREALARAHAARDTGDVGVGIFCIDTCRYIIDIFNTLRY